MCTPHPNAFSGYFEGWTTSSFLCELPAVTFRLRRGSLNRPSARECSTGCSRSLNSRFGFALSNPPDQQRQYLKAVDFRQRFHSSATSRRLHISAGLCAYACVRARCSHRVHQCCSRGHHTSISGGCTTKYASPSPSLPDCGRVAHLSVDYASRDLRESDRCLYLSCRQRSVESYSARPGSAPRRYARGHCCTHASSAELRQRRLSCGFCCSSVHPLGSSC